MLVRTLFAWLAVSLPVFAQTPQWGQDTVYSVSGLPANSTNRMAVADLNADGRSDVVLIRASGNGFVLMGQAAGGLQLLATQVSASGTSLSLGDLDGDGIVDILAVGSGVVMKKGVGDGTFTTMNVPLGLNPANASAGIVGDFNADGLNDVAVALTGEVRVALGVPGGTYLLPYAFTCCTSAGALTTQIADFNSDGVQDLFVACASSFTIVFGSSVGSLTAQSYGRGTTGFPAIGDFTGDGVTDIVVGGGDLLLGLNNGQFVPGPPLISPASGRMRTFDCDGDGSTDILVPITGGNFGISRNNAGLGMNNSFQMNILTAIQDTATAHIAGDPRPEILLLADQGSNSRIVTIKNQAPNCNQNAIDDVIEVSHGLVTDCDSNGVPDECQTDCDDNDIPDVCQITAQPSLDLDVDGTLDVCEVVGTPYCFGDGTGVLCPCDPGQAGAVGSGCKNSAGSGGKLRAVGNAHVVLDSVTISSSGLGPFAMGMLYQGTTPQSGGLGMAFGDGLLCVNGTVIRFQPRPASSDGLTDWGRAIPGDLPIATYGQLPATGGTRFYQVWYRDSHPAFCTSFTYNLTSGLEITWAH